MDAELLVAECHLLLPGIEVPIVEYRDVVLPMLALNVEVSKELNDVEWIL